MPVNTVLAQVPAPICPGDVNSDGVMDVFDFAEVAADVGCGGLR